MLAPSIVSITLVLGGILGLVREPRRVDWVAWGLLIAGGVAVYAAFVWDWRYIVDGGYPRWFPWPLFWAGEVAGMVGVARAHWKAAALGPRFPYRAKSKDDTFGVAVEKRRDHE